VVVPAISTGDFEQALCDYPQLTISLRKAAAEAMHEAPARVLEATTLPVEARITRTL
jgi:hypothetical protein